MSEADYMMDCDADDWDRDYSDEIRDAIDDARLTVKDAETWRETMCDKPEDDTGKRYGRYLPNGGK